MSWKTEGHNVEDDNWKKKRDNKLEKIFPCWKKTRVETCLEERKYKEERIGRLSRWEGWRCCQRRNKRTVDQGDKS